MRQVTITRTETGPNGTFGNLATDSGFQCYFVECPWADNKVGESCIFPKPGDEAKYECEIVDSPKYGKVYGIKEVPGRDNVLLHAANWSRQLKGCVALGRAIGEVMGNRGVMSSHDAIAGFMADMENKPFMLTIQWAHDATGVFRS